MNRTLHEQLRDQHDQIETGTLLANDRYCLQEPHQVIQVTDDLYEVVWRADDLQTMRPVTISELCLRGYPFQVRQAASRTILQVLGTIEAPFAQVTDFFSERHLRCFSVTPCLRGQTLRERLRSGVLAQQEAVECGWQICQALEPLAHQGMVHGFLSPDCLLRTARGGWTLTYLPLLSLLVARGILALPADWHVPASWPLARTEGAAVDADALLAILAAAVIGSVPSSGVRLSGSALAAPLSSPLAALFAKGLHPDPAQRYATLEDLAGDLKQVYVRLGGHLPSPREARSRSGVLSEPLAHLPSSPVMATESSVLRTLPQAHFSFVGRNEPTRALPGVVNRSLVLPPQEEAPMLAEETPTRGDLLVSAGWLGVLNVVLLFLATRGG